MTLDQAIDRYSNNAEYERRNGSLQGCLDFRQLAEWLKDYKRLLEQQPCERFEWGIDGNVYKITKAKDGKEICQQVCRDAVSREAALEKMADYVASGYADSAEDFEKYSRIICQLPPVTPQPKTGRWIDYRDEGFVECPFCGHATNCEDDIDELHYCFYCGCRMVEPQESEGK